ncbi:hypothetical protein [Pediococcus ethanolidurans]
MAEIASFGVNVDENTKLAQNAQQTANKARTGIGDLNDPNLMSVIEKQYNISQFAGLTSQYNVLIRNAKDDGIDTTDLTTAYNSLNEFMANILKDPDHASDIDRVAYKKYQDAYNEELANLQNALQNNANNKFASAASASSQAASTASQAFSAADSAYNYANSEITIQSAATAKAQSVADSAFSQAKTAIDTGQAASQAVTDLKDGSTLTIAELGSGLASKVASSEYASYKTQTASQVAQMVTSGAFSAYSQATAELISAKVATSDFSSYKDQTAKSIDSKVESSDFNTYKTQTADAITSKVATKDFDSYKTQTANDIDLRVEKKGLIDEINLQAGKTLISSSGQLTLSGKNINFDTTNPVIIPSANIDTLLVDKKLTAADISANTFSTNNETFTVDKDGAITAKNMTLIGGTFSSPTISAGIINGSTINGTTINTPTLNLGTNGTLTTDFDISQDTSLYGPKKGTGTLTIKTGVINSSSDNMSRYSNTKHYWYGFDDHGNVVKNGTNHTGDDYAPGYEKHDIMKSNGAVLNRSYLDAMGLMFTEGGNSTYNTMLTGVGLEAAAALLHKDLVTDGTFKAALGTDGTYGFNISNKVVAPMVRANSITYSANMYISRHGYMATSTSTKANKLDIVDVPDMLQKGYNLLTINPRQWFDKTSVEAYADVQSGNSDSIESVVDIKPVSGMVAEEVASAGLDDYVIKDENNKVQGLAYDRLWTLLLPVLRDMNDRLNEAQLEITKLKRGCLK